MLISIHIPKCAGTSFRTILQAHYRERVWNNYGGVFSRAEAAPGIVPAGTQCIHGHFLADAFDDQFAEREYITWLRHPVERVVSTYHHFSHTPDFRDDCCRALYQRQLSLREFADLEWMGNTATRYAAGKSPAEFAFVGIVEQFGESLLRFRERFGVGPSVPVPHNNVNAARNLTRNRLSAADFDYILSRNASDYWWYEKARADLHRDQRGVIAFPSHGPVGAHAAPARRVSAGGLAGAWWTTGTARPASA